MQITRWQLILQSRLSWMSTMPQNKLLTTQYANLFKYINTTEKDIYNLYITHLNMSSKARNNLRTKKPQCTNVIHPTSCYHRQAGGKSVMTSVQRTELHRLLRAKGEVGEGFLRVEQNKQKKTKSKKKIHVWYIYVYLPTFSWFLCFSCTLRILNPKNGRVWTCMTQG